MAYTTEQYEALKAAYAAGILTVSHSGRTVTYRSRAEMKAILREMEAELGIKTATPMLQPVAIRRPR